MKHETNLLTEFYINLNNKNIKQVFSVNHGTSSYTQGLHFNLITHINYKFLYFMLNSILSKFKHSLRKQEIK